MRLYQSIGQDGRGPSNWRICRCAFFWMTKRRILDMTKLNISEAGTVQFPMVRHAAETGWTPLPPQAAARKRGGEAGLLFRAEIEEALGRFNPWMTAGAIRATVEKLEALPPTIEGNREMLAWLRGERQGYDETEQLHRPVRLIDFETPGANVFHISWEWKIKPPARKGNRADVMFVVNGVPVVIVEHKNPTDADAIERGITQLRRYEKETPELMGAAQLFNVTHLLDYWYGVTWNASRRFMARWKERQEESYRFAVQSFFEPTDLADQEVGFQDFVIAHELLHLRVPNHAKLFKALMTMHVPDWKKYAMGKQSVAYGSNIAPEGDAGRTREKLCRRSSTTKKTAWPLCH